MSRLMKSFVVSIGALLSLPTYADMLNVDGIIIEVTDGRLPQGIVWQSSRYFSNTVPFKNLFISSNKASLVLTDSSNDSLEFIYSTIQSLPVDIGNGLKLTFLGSVSGSWGESTMSWSASSYQEAKTKSFTTTLASHAAFDGISNADQNASEGKLSYQLWPIIYCDKTQGCEVPNNTTKTIGNYYLRIYSKFGLFSSSPSEQIIKTGKITFKTGCKFNISPTVFRNIEFRRSLAGTLHWTDKSDVSATCGSGGNLNVRVTPTAGILSEDNRIGLTSRDGLGLVYKFGTSGVQKLSDALAWNTDQTHSKLVNNGSDYTTSGSIFWSLYQYSDDLLPGEFTATVNYEFWID